MWKNYLIFSLLLQCPQQVHSFLSLNPRSARYYHPTDDPTTTEVNAAKKRKIRINPDLEGVASISDDGTLTLQKKQRKEAREAREKVRSKLGVPSKKPKGGGSGISGSNSSGGGGTKRLSKKAETLARQRNGTSGVDSRLQAGLALPEDQAVEVQVSKRGNKQVTIVRGMTSPMDDRKKLLKEMKRKLGGGGSMIEGVLELQGAHGDKILELLKIKGYSKGKIVK